MQLNITDKLYHVFCLCRTAAIVLLFSMQGFAQQIFSPGEVVTELTVNPVLIKKYHERKEKKMIPLSSAADTIDIPFLDDFSQESIYPNR